MDVPDYHSTNVKVKTVKAKNDEDSFLVPVDSRTAGGLQVSIRL